ncbi:MAG: hypothetical protein IJ056_01470 [Acidaminococcaceae bacterium]|nr:hypothetical protein [Acidaminococcaceae bacterium]
MNKVTNEKLPRGLDGFFLRVKRGDRYVNRCFTDLTEEEQRNWLDRLSAEGLRRMTGELLNCVQKMKDMQDLTCLNNVLTWQRSWVRAPVRVPRKISPKPQ